MPGRRRRKRRRFVVVIGVFIDVISKIFQGPRRLLLFVPYVRVEEVSRHRKDREDEPDEDENPKVPRDGNFAGLLVEGKVVASE